MPREHGLVELETLVDLFLEHGVVAALEAVLGQIGTNLRDQRSAVRQKTRHRHIATCCSMWVPRVCTVVT